MNRVKQLVHAENVYRMGYTGKNIRVVTLDTGVYLHPDLRQNVVGFLDFVAMKRACYDDNGHGTHVGGILCANGRMKGMAPQAQLIALKVLGKDGGGQTERVIRGLQWVLAHHKELGIRILNFSVGFLPGALDREQKQIMELLEQLWDDGVTVVTAAGNNGPGAGTVTAPGISRKVITVGASDDRSSPGERRGGYSGSDARCFLLAGCVAGLGVSGCRGAQPVPAILQFYGEKGKGVHGHLLRRAGKDECIRCAICAGNARGEDFRTECPLVSSVQRRDSGLQDLCLEVLRHIPERDDSFYRPAQFTGDVHSSYGYFVDTSQSAVAFVGGGVAIFHHHGTWHDFASL